MSEEQFPDLRRFIDALRRDGDLVVVDTPVDPRLEVAEIHRRVIAAGGPALLFTHVVGADFPLVTNLYGTARRAERAFGRRPLALVRDLVRLAETLLPPTLGKLWRARGLATDLLKVGLRRGRSGPIRDVVTADMNLRRLPALTSWSEDGGPFLTLPLVYTERPGAVGPGRSNLGMYRMQVHDERTTGLHWQIGKGGGFHFSAAERQGHALPVTVFVGGPPALTLAAIAPLPENVPEIMLASLLAGHRLPTCPGPGPHALLAEAEFALVGHAPPGVRRPEGPFGDHYGYYSMQHDYPVFEVEWLCRRHDAIFPATVVGKPRQEDFFIGDLLQELLAPLFPLAMPGVVDLWSYGETGYHSLAAAVVQERYRREAMASAFRILGEGQLSLTKFLLVTDRPVDLRDFRRTLEHILARTRPETDLYVFPNVAMDTLDYTGPRVSEGSKGVWLGLGDPVRELPREFRPGTYSFGGLGVRVFCGGCLVVAGPSYAEEPTAAKRIASHPAFAGWPLVVLTDDADRAVRSPTSFLWTTFTRFDPATDLHAASTRLVGSHVVREAPIVVDARMKPSYPAELSCDPATAALVARRWREYFPTQPVEMGDSESAHLDRP
jgi:UbiD family decarboxylase